MIAGFVIISVLVLALMAGGIYLSISKKKSSITLGLILASIHLAFVLFAAYDRYTHKSEFPGFEFFLYFVDMPISLALKSVAGFLDLSDRNADFYFVYFGVLGTIQYFLFGLLLGFLHRKSRV